MDIATSANGRRGLYAWFAVLLLFLYAPLALLLMFSFNDNNLPVFPLRGFTTQAYEDFAANPELRGAIVTSAQVAALSSVVAVALGLLAAIALVRRRFFGRAPTSALLLSPLVVPYIALAIGLLVFFNEVSLSLGVRTIVMGHVVVSIPYTILILAPRLGRLDIRLEEAARDLGATTIQTFRLITLPLILPAIVSAFLVAFVISFDEIVIASFVAGETTTFPLYLFSQLRFPTLLPQVIAVASVVMAASVLVLIAAEIGRRVVERRLGTELVEPAGVGGA
ncbi:MAG TPA: ABC transporter permease [Gaiellaceae bacterium]|jgi:spermidine/putrescine transport system permease protein|nr:ABC transporter permease [Gaiellaceae bacterium]